MAPRINYSGLVIAGIGFFLTRFTVTLAIYEGDPVRFYLAGVVPLVLGLGLAAFGVALTVANVDRSLVRTTARWCVIGAVTMLVLVVLTLLGSSTGGVANLSTAASQSYLSNFLIGGSVGGTFTGLYAARNQRQRDALGQQANRLEILNRILRHEILTGVNVSRGTAARRADDPGGAQAVIERRSDDIEATIEEVKYLSRSARTSQLSRVPVSLDECLDRSVETTRKRHPEAEISIDPPPSRLSVLANQQLDQVFVHLLENAVVHTSGEKPHVTVRVETTADSVSVSVHDRGDGIPERQRALLESGTIDEFDDPSTGFGLNVVRLLVEGYRGSIETHVDDEGSTVTVVLPRATTEDADYFAFPSDVTGLRHAVPPLLVTFGAALFAGVVYGVVAELFGGSVGFIGVYYGVQNTVVGWITHEFHSVVFGFAFAGIVSVAPARYRNSSLGFLAIALGWALVVWIVAAGFVSSIWLNLLGVAVPIPSLSELTFAAHVAWGIALGVATLLGHKFLAPGIERFLERAVHVRDRG